MTPSEDGYYRLTGPTYASDPPALTRQAVKSAFDCASARDCGPGRRTC
jgi:hypothetical protein